MRNRIEEKIWEKGLDSRVIGSSIVYSGAEKKRPDLRWTRILHNKTQPTLLEALQIAKKVETSVEDLFMWKPEELNKQVA